MKSRLLATGYVCISILISISANAAPISVHTTDFIPNASRTNFNSFENLPELGEGPVLSNGVLLLNDPSEAFHVEDDILVGQIFHAFVPGEERYGIWTTHFPSDGRRDWYPNDGDDGYTRITLDGGGRFEQVGFTVSSGVSANKYLYILLNDGAVTAEGYVPQPDGNSYLGFSGGLFDEVLVRSINSPGENFNFFDQTANGLSIDAIEAVASSPVPIPPALWLFGSGLIGLVGMARRKAA